MSGLRRLPSLAAAALSLGVVVVGLHFGARAVGGADSYGYASEARLLASGALRIEQRLAQQVESVSMREALVPLGYVRPPHATSSLVPVYPPGLPLTMAMFERVGGPGALFFVVPLFGGLAVWLTYLLGVKLGGRGVGLIAALLVASSPVFLYQLMFPMSDVPATAWWMLALLLITIERRDAALAAGLAAGAAILTRPNLVPVGIALGLFLVWRAVRGESPRGPRFQRAALYAAGAVAGCLAVAFFNARWYGSPLANGYGRFGDLYAWQHVTTNLARYGTWLVDTETPFILIAVAGPFLAARLAARGRLPREAGSLGTLLGLVAVVVALCYLFYLPFDAWWFLRFLLPAFPALMVLAAFVLSAAASRLTDRVAGVAMAVVIGALVWHGLSFARQNGAFAVREGERKYEAAGSYVARHLPDNAVLVSWQHSGSLIYYSGRPTLRYDILIPEILDAALDVLRDLGYHPYFVLERWEEDVFRTRFHGVSRLATLDWTPVARLDHASGLEIFDPSDADRPSRAAPDVIP